jgi:hypothetical protein
MKIDSEITLEKDQTDRRYAMCPECRKPMSAHALLCRECYARAGGVEAALYRSSKLRGEARGKPVKRLAAVIQAASAHGLKCEELPADKPGLFRFRKRLLIESRKCQIVPSLIKYVDGSRSEHMLRHLYLPSTEWADFLIYAASERRQPENRQPENFEFYIVPRGDATKSTVVCSPENWLLKYKDAWKLLTEDLPANRLARRYEKLNWKVAFVEDRAKSLGFKTELVKKAVKNRPAQNRILINERRCQTIALARLSADAKSERWNYVKVYASKQTWAEFLIFLLKTEGSEQVRVFVIPREHLQHDTTTALNAAWLNTYADNWRLLDAATGAARA